MKMFTLTILSAVPTARADAGFERRPDSPRANAERVHADAEPGRQIATAFDALPPRITVVLDDQVALFLLQLAKASIEALEALFLSECGVVCVGGRPPGDSIHVTDVVQRNVSSLSTEILEQNELGNDVAVALRRSCRDGAGLFQRAADSIECLVGERIGRRAISSIEVRDEPPAHFQVRLARGIDAVVQPYEEAGERDLCECRFLLCNLLCEHGRAACKTRDGSASLASPYDLSLSDTRGDEEEFSSQLLRA
jgi:hypothetical protein